MEASFAADGDSGLLMMCNTAALQINVDLDAEGARWRLADHLGPMLVATFANSPFVDGAQRAQGGPAGQLVGDRPVPYGAGRDRV